MKVLNYFKAMGDPTRIRILALLMVRELSVNEIVAVLGMGQSRISRHLKILTDSGLLESRRDGLWIFYRSALSGGGERFIDAIKGFLDGQILKSDIKKLETVTGTRSKEKIKYFDSIAGDWETIKSGIIGDVDIENEIVARIGTPVLAVDIGCGNGDLLEQLLGRSGSVIGIDKSSGMIEEARHRFSGNGKKLELRIGEIEHLPMKDGEADAAVINMVLHHVDSPEKALAETSRILGKNGRLVLVDLDRHSNEEMRKKYGHRRLGFSRQEIESLLNNSGFALDEFKSYKAKHGLRLNLFSAVIK